jgi:hypothetical protein
MRYAERLFAFACVGHYSQTCPTRFTSLCLLLLFGHWYLITLFHSINFSYAVLQLFLLLQKALG